MKEASESSDSKRLHCPEVLSQPNFIGKDASGIHNATFQPIMMTDADIRKDRYSNILFSGGTTNFQLEDCAPGAQIGNFVDWS